VRKLGECGAARLCECMSGRVGENGGVGSCYCESEIVRL
jgi:hypothetical protein